MSVDSPQPTDLFTHDYTAANSGAITVPFEEVTPKSGPVSKGALGYGLQGNSNARTYLVYFEDVQQFIYEACGYPERVTTAGGGVSLSRHIPIRDPEFFWLVASRAADISPYGAKLDHHETAYGPLPEYEYYHVTLLFEALPYDILDDANLQAYYAGDESRRYTETRWEYGGQFLTRETGNFVYVEGVASGYDFAQPIGMFEAHQRFVIRWAQLPEIGIMNSYKLLNTNIRNARGTVNLHDWPTAEASGGFKAGTLRCEDIRTAPAMAPLDPDLLGLFRFNPPRVVDLEIVIDYFDPPLGSGATTRGHNCLPWPTDNLYYQARSNNTLQPLYQSYDFAQIFQIQ
jgi:hypothetical protein